MRRLIALVALVVGTPVANAQDKGKPDFTHNAEFRVRDTYEMNESGASDSKSTGAQGASNPAHHNGIDQRFKLGLGFKANEKFSIWASLLQSASWGQGPNETLGDRGATTGASSPSPADERNFLSVNEAYATWMMADDLNWKIGRMNFAFGDGSVMSVNDFQAQPYSFDGVVANFEAEFGRFQAFAFKYRDLSGTLGTGLTNGQAYTSDAQHNAYGLVFDLKTMPEWVKTVNAYIIQDSADGVNSPAGMSSTVGGQQGQNATRYGALAGFNFGLIDLKGQYNSVSGKNTDFPPAVTGVGTVRSIAEAMYQAELGLNFPAFMGARLFALYHNDSGTGTGDRKNDGTKVSDKTYDPYFYDRHYSAGQMELVGWGNLTDIAAGLTLKPSDTTDVGFAYHGFSKTTAADVVNPGTYGQNLFTVTNNSSLTAAKIGDEIDLWAEHRYDGGLSILARLGYFKPGATLTDSLIGKKDSITQAMVQGKLSF